MGISKPRSVEPATSAKGVDEATAEEFVVALADRDFERLEACFDHEVRMRALVPPGFQELSGAPAVIAKLNSWFEDAENIQVLQKNVYRVADRLHVRYRFRTQYSNGETDIVEQDAYLDLREGAIATIDLLCSGFRPESDETRPVQKRFDAGNLGCSSGLPEEFRRQIDGIPIGSTLEITTRDPSAKEDLPSLSRLLGHRVVSVSNSPDGSTVLVVQRGR
jgi:TusA-related sulfurtransferase